MPLTLSPICIYAALRSHLRFTCADHMEVLGRTEHFHNLLMPLTFSISRADHFQIIYCSMQPCGASNVLGGTLVGFKFATVDASAVTLSIISTAVLMLTNNMPHSTLLCACYCQNLTCFVIIINYYSRLRVVSQSLNLAIHNNSEAFFNVTSRRSQSLNLVIQNNTEELFNATSCRSQSQNFVIQNNT